MPLTREAQVASALRMREDDQKFIAKFGKEKWQEKLDNEGCVVYRYLNSIYHDLALDVAQEMAEDYLHGDNPSLKEKYRKTILDLGIFDCNFENLAKFRGIGINFDKPFPIEGFELRMRDLILPFGRIPVYRATELTEQEIRHGGFGIVYGSYYVDTYERVRPRQTPIIDGGQLGFDFSREKVKNPRPFPHTIDDQEVIASFLKWSQNQKDPHFADLIVGSRVLSASDLFWEISSGSEIGDQQLFLIESYFNKHPQNKHYLQKWIETGNSF